MRSFSLRKEKLVGGCGCQTACVNSNFSHDCLLSVAVVSHEVVKNANGERAGVFDWENF